MSRTTAWIVAGVLLAALAGGGCEKPLFPKDLPRSPYERYQVLHGRQRPLTEENAYGGDEPAIRERLKPLDAQ